MFFVILFITRHSGGYEYNTEYAVQAHARHLYDCHKRELSKLPSTLAVIPVPSSFISEALGVLTWT